MRFRPSWRSPSRESRLSSSTPRRPQPERDHTDMDALSPLAALTIAVVIVGLVLLTLRWWLTKQRPIPNLQIRATVLPTCGSTEARGGGDHSPVLDVCTAPTA